MQRLILIAVPYAWLLALFLVPFLIVFKISLSDVELAIPPYTPTLSDGFVPFFKALCPCWLTQLTEEGIQMKYVGSPIVAHC